MKNHEYTIKVSLINKIVEKDSREESFTDASEIESIRSRLAILMDKIDVLDPQGFGTEKLSSKILENFNFNIEISKESQETNSSEEDKSLFIAMSDDSYQLIINDKNYVAAVAQKMYELKQQTIVTHYKEISTIDSIKKGVKKFLERLLTHPCDRFEFQFEDKHSASYRVDMTLTSQGKESIKEQSSANFQKLVESLVDESFVLRIENEWKYLSPEGNNGLCIDGPVIGCDSVCGNFHTEIRTVTTLSSI